MMMMNKIAYRRVQSLLLMLTISVLWAAFYLQYVGGLQPCPLCLAQRACLFIIGFFCFTGYTVASPRRARVVAGFQMFFALAGLFFALRQLWLQFLPADQVPACLPGLDVLVHYFPWHHVLYALFWGTGDCAEVTWRLFGFSMPAWAALYFACLFLASAVVFFLLGRTKVGERT